MRLICRRKDWKTLRFFSLLKYKNFWGSMSVFRHRFLLVFTLFFLLGMHYVAPNTGGVGLEMPYNNLAWIFVAVLIAQGLMEVRRTGRIVYSDYNLVLFLVFLVLLIPFFYSNSDGPENVIERTLGLLAGLLVFFSIKQFQLESKHWLLLICSIVAACIIESTYAWIQYWQPLHRYWSFTLPQVPFGVFQQPNNMASFCVTAIACSYYLLDRSEQVLTQRQLLKYRYVAILCVALSGFIVVVVQSRTGWLSLVLILAIILIYGFKADSKETKLWKRYWFYMLALSILLGALSLGSGERARRSFEMVEQLGQIRRETWHICWLMIKEAPWFGYGYGDFQSAFLHYQAQYFMETGLYAAGNHRYPHNELAYWVVEGGVLPLVAILAGVIYGVRALYIREGVRTWLIITMLAPLVIHSLLEYPFYQAVSQWVIFIVLLAYTDSSAKVYEIKSSLAIFPGVAAILLVLLTSTYMLATIQARYWLLEFLGGKDKNLSTLAKVYMPAGMMELYMKEAMIVRVYLGMASGNAEEMRAFLSWVPERMRRSPHSTFYLAWLRAHYVLGEEEKAKQVLLKARELFPMEKVFFGDKVYDYKEGLRFELVSAASSISSEVVNKNNKNQSGNNIAQQKTPEAIQ